MSIGRAWTAEETLLRQFEWLLQPFRRREHLSIADLAVGLLIGKDRQWAGLLLMRFNSEKFNDGLECWTSR